MNNVRQFISESKTSNTGSRTGNSRSRNSRPARKRYESNRRTMVKRGNGNRNIKLTINEDFDMLSNMEDFAKGIVDADGTLNNPLDKDFLRLELSQNFVEASDEDIDKVIKKFDLKENRRRSTPVKLGLDEGRTKNFKDWSNRDIIDDIIKNHKRITGKPIKSLYGDDEELIFNQKTIDDTEPALRQYLTKHGLSDREIDDLYYDLDDELARKRYESRKSCNGRKRLTENTWCGVPGTAQIWNGEWSDPEIAYKDFTFNEWEVQDALYDVFVQETGDETGEVDNNYFDEWIAENPDEVINELEDIIDGYGVDFNNLTIDWLIKTKQKDVLSELFSDWAIEETGDDYLYWRYKTTDNADEILRDYYKGKRFKASDFSSYIRLW